MRVCVCVCVCERVQVCECVYKCVNLRGVVLLSQSLFLCDWLMAASVCVSAWVCLSVSVLSVCPSIYLALYIYQSVCLSVRRCVCFLSVCLLSALLPVSPSVSLFFLSLTVFQSPRFASCCECYLERRVVHSVQQQVRLQLLCRPAIVHIAFHAL